MPWFDEDNDDDWIYESQSNHDCEDCDYFGLDGGCEYDEGCVFDDDEMW